MRRKSTGIYPENWAEIAANVKGTMGHIEGKIAAILDATTVVINRGSQDGVRKGLPFYVYTELGPFDDPNTGDSLGTITQMWGKVVVSQVADRLCLARTGYWRHPAWDSVMLASMFTQPGRIQLPIDKNQAQGWLTKIRVGTSVKSEHPSKPAVYNTGILLLMEVKNG